MNITQKTRKIVWRIKGLLRLNDYWVMGDKELIFMANSLGIIDMYDYGTPTHNDFEASITKSKRKLIIDELIKRDKHITSYTAFFISLLALIVSILALVF